MKRFKNFWLNQVKKAISLLNERVVTLIMIHLLTATWMGYVVVAVRVQDYSHEHHIAFNPRIEEFTIVYAGVILLLIRQLLKK